MYLGKEKYTIGVFDCGYNNKLYTGKKMNQVGLELTRKESLYPKKLINNFFYMLPQTLIMFSFSLILARICTLNSLLSKYTAF